MLTGKGPTASRSPWAHGMQQPERQEAGMDAADIVIIGAGAGAKLIWGSVPGRSVAVVEQEPVGGYCPFYACVPSKAMLRSARVWGLGADEQFSGLFTGRSDPAVAYRQAVARRKRIVNGLDASHPRGAEPGRRANLDQRAGDEHQRAARVDRRHRRGAGRV